MCKITNKTGENRKVTITGKYGEVLLSFDIDINKTYSNDAIKIKLNTYILDINMLIE